MTYLKVELRPTQGFNVKLESPFNVELRRGSYLGSFVVPLDYVHRVVRVGPRRAA